MFLLNTVAVGSVYAGSSNLSLNLNAQITEDNSQQVRHGSEPNELLRVLKHKNVHLDGDGTVSRGSAAQWEWSENWSAEIFISHTHAALRSAAVRLKLWLDELEMEVGNWGLFHRGIFLSVHSLNDVSVNPGWIESDSYCSLIGCFSLAECHGNTDDSLIWTDLC